MFVRGFVNYFSVIKIKTMVVILDMEKNSTIETSCSDISLMFWNTNVQTRDDFQFFLDSNNSLDPSINFTIEWEENNSLPFLDVTAHRNLSHFQFSIYRKPTHSSMFLHYFSY